MNDDEAALFLLTLAALGNQESGSASPGLIEDAEPMTATCTVERSE
jgi:hypothetical protein